MHKRIGHNLWTNISVWLHWEYKSRLIWKLFYWLEGCHKDVLLINIQDVLIDYRSQVLRLTIQGIRNFSHRIIFFVFILRGLLGK